MRTETPRRRESVGYRWFRTALSGSAFAAAACSSGAKKPRADAVDLAATDTAPAIPPAVRNRAADTARSQASATAARAARLSPLADSVSAFLVFAPIGEAWFTAASRNRRMLVDIGRVDTEVRRPPGREAAYREAVAKRSTVLIGTKFRLRGPWGAEDVTATAVDSWNGRVVLVLSGSPLMDSLARGKTTVVATAFRTDSATPAIADSCDRTTPLSAVLAARAGQVRDSLTQELRSGPQPPYERLRRKTTIGSSQVVGCFGPARIALAVNLRAGNVEWVRERVVLIDTLGKVTSLRVSDYRFRAHELVAAFDADGDGVDDLATRATTERAGATTILLLDPKTKRLARLTVGFAWEDQ